MAAFNFSSSPNYHFFQQTLQNLSRSAFAIFFSRNSFDFRKFKQPPIRGFALDCGWYNTIYEYTKYNLRNMRLFRKMSSEAKQCGNRECKSLGLLLCSRCRDVFYCSQKCQKLNWKDHKIICSKTKDSTTGSQASQNKTDVCQNGECGENGTLKCSRCKSVRYCSKSCQGKDWKNHKKICKRSVAGSGENSPRSKITYFSKIIQYRSLYF